MSEIVCISVSAGLIDFLSHGYFGDSSASVEYFRREVVS